MRVFTPVVATSSSPLLLLLLLLLTAGGVVASAAAAGSLAACEDRWTRASCEPPCVWSVEGHCSLPPCAHFASEPECRRVEAGNCTWDAVSALEGACVFAGCEAMSVDRCTGQCAAAVPHEEGRAGASGAADAVCRDAALLRLPCVVLDRATCVLAAPSGRCHFDDETSRCLPQTSPDGVSEVPCSSVVGQEQCAADPRCDWEHGLCINPSCASAAAAEDPLLCDRLGCRRVTGSAGEQPSCVDRNVWEHFPCVSFSGHICPTFRCSRSSGDDTCNSFAPLPPPPARCGEIASAADCVSSSTPLCVWSREESQCKAPPCASFAPSQCPAVRCQNTTTTTPRVCAETCPASSALPVVCPSGACAASDERCTTCGALEVQCWDGVCVRSQDLCTCPPARPHRCPGSVRCAASSDECSQQCDAASEHPTLCWDGTCASNDAACPCPPALPYSCVGADLTRRCVRSSADCSRVCPSVTPFACWNGACAVSEASCPCDPQHSIFCTTGGAGSTGGRCVRELSDCPCPTEAQPVRCTSTRCAADRASCDAVRPPCTTSAPLRCSDGTCVSSRAVCPCGEAERANAIPSVSIDAPSLGGRFDVSQWLRLTARVSLTVCGEDLSHLVRVRWSVSADDSGELVEASGAAAQLVGRGASFGPRAFFPSVDRALAFTAVATAVLPGIGDAAAAPKSSSSSITLTPTMPLPTVSLKGGSLRRVHTTGVTLSAAIADPLDAPSQSVAVSWRCCTGDGCLDECPSVIADLLAQHHTADLRSHDPWPVGRFVISAFVRGVEATQVVEVVANDAPLVEFATAIPSPHFSTQPLHLYARARVPSQSSGGGNSVHVVFDWFVNEERDEGLGHTGAVRIPAGRLMPGTHATITARARVESSAEDVFGEASVVIAVASLVEGECSVDISDESAVVVAGETELRIVASFNATTAASAAPVAFRFTRVRVMRHNDDGATIDDRDTHDILVPSAIPAPLLELRAPFFSGAPWATMRFRVEAVRREAVLGYALCDINVQQSAAGASAAGTRLFLEERVELVRHLAEDGERDAFGILRASQEALATLADARPPGSSGDDELWANTTRNLTHAVIKGLNATLPRFPPSSSSADGHGDGGSAGMTREERRAAAVALRDIALHATAIGAVDAPFAHELDETSAGDHIAELIGRALGDPRAAFECRHRPDSPRCAETTAEDLAAVQMAVSALSLLPSRGARANVARDIARAVAMATPLGEVRVVHAADTRHADGEAEGGSSSSNSSGGGSSSANATRNVTIVAAAFVGSSIRGRFVQNGDGGSLAIAFPNDFATGEDDETVYGVGIASLDAPALHDLHDTDHHSHHSHLQEQWSGESSGSSGGAAMTEAETAPLGLAVTMLAEFQVYHNDRESAVERLENAIELHVPLRALPGGGAEEEEGAAVANATCRFFNATRREWSDAGVTSHGLAPSGAAIRCRTTHLTPFAAFAAPPPPPPPPEPETATTTTASEPESSPATAPTTTSPSESTPVPPATGSGIPVPTFAPGGAAGDDDDSIGAQTAIIVGAICGGILVVALIAAVAMKCSKGGQGTGMKAGGSGGGRGEGGAGGHFLEQELLPTGGGFAMHSGAPPAPPLVPSRRLPYDEL